MKNHLLKTPTLCDGMQGHNYEFPDCVKAILEARGLCEDFNYWDLGWLSGDCLAQVYNRNRTDFCSYGVSGYLAGEKYIRSFFEKLGFAIEYHAAENSSFNTAEKIRSAIDNDIPVLVHTDLKEMYDTPTEYPIDVMSYGLIVGYEVEGEILRLLLLMPDNQEYSYSFGDGKKIDYIFVGEQTVPKNRTDIHLAAWQNVVKLLQYGETSSGSGKYIGISAYRAWVDDILAGHFTDEKLNGNWWGNWGVYVCNLATNGSPIPALCKCLSHNEKDEYAVLSDKLNKLLPCENPAGGGRCMLWIALEENKGGMDMDCVKESMQSAESREKIAKILISYAEVLETVVEMLI